MKATLPKEWKMVKLGEVCTIRKGTAITKKMVVGGDVPVIAGGQEPAYYHNEHNSNGDVITVSASGAYAGYLNYFEGPIFASDCSTIESLDKNKLLTFFVFLMLKGKQQYIYSLCSGAAQPHIYPKDLINIKILLPPLPTQHKIVEILEEADNLRKLRQKADEKMKDLIPSLFVEMFGNPATNPKGWKMEKLENIIDLQGGYAFKSSDFVDSGIPLVRIGNANKGEFDTGNLVFLPATNISEDSNFILNPGDVLITLTGTVGKDDYGNVTIVPGIYRKWFLNQRVAKVEIKNDSIERNHLICFLKHPYIKRNIIKQSRGVRQANLNNKDILSQNIPVPPLPLQQEFAERVKEIEEEKKRQAESKKKLDDIFNSLMQRAFRGELVA